MHLSLSDLFCIIGSSFIHLIRTDSNALLFRAGWVIFHCVYVPQLIHSSVDGHLGCFRVLAIVNSAAMNNGIHVSFSVLVSLGCIAKLFLLRSPLTSMSLNVTSNSQLCLTWSLISTGLFHWLTGHGKSPVFPSTFMNIFTDFVTIFYSSILKFPGFHSKPPFFHVTNLPIRSHPLAMHSSILAWRILWTV